MLIGIERGYQIIGSQHWRQRLRQTLQVPQADAGLLTEGVAPLGIRMVTDKVFLEGIEEGEGAKVEAVTENRHIVGIHHPVGKAHRLPVGYHARGITYHQSKPGLVAHSPG